MPPIFTRSPTSQGAGRQILTDIFRDVLENDSITLNDDTTANDIAEWDSQSHINLVLAVEMRFGVRFRTSELDTLKNVGEFVSVIDSKLAQRGKAT